jgi:hypothetical protein
MAILEQRPISEQFADHNGRLTKPIFSHWHGIDRRPDARYIATTLVTLPDHAPFYARLCRACNGALSLTVPGLTLDSALLADLTRQALQAWLEVSR